jgi:hypothetical protein
VNDFDTRQNSLCPSEGFESRHQFYPAFDVTVVLLNQVVQVITLPDLNAVILLPAGIKPCKGSRVCTAFINSHHFRFAVLADGLAEEAQRGSSIPFSRQQEVDGLPRCIDRAVQLFPLAFNFDVGFVHSPPATHRAFTSAKRFIQQRDEADNPAMKGGMVNDNTPLCHHLFQVA